MLLEAPRRLLIDITAHELRAFSASTSLRRTCPGTVRTLRPSPTENSQALALHATLSPVVPITKASEASMLSNRHHLAASEKHCGFRRQLYLSLLIGHPRPIEGVRTMGTRVLYSSAWFQAFSRSICVVFGCLNGRTVWMNASSHI